MKAPQKTPVLCVHPPVASPSAPPWMPARIAGRFGHVPVSLTLYDANLDFFLNFLFKPERREDFCSRIARRQDRSHYAGADAATLSCMEAWRGKPEKGARIFKRLEQDQNLLRSDDFFHPVRLAKALKDMEAVFALASTAFYPSRITWNRFDHPRIVNRKDRDAFLEDRDVNPFLGWGLAALASRLEDLKPEYVVFCVSSPGQVLPAMTMMRLVKKWRQDAHVVLAGNRRWLVGTGLEGDSLWPEVDAPSILDGLSIPDPEAVPQFQALPLHQYLAPATVLPLGEPGWDDKGMAASSRIGRLRDRAGQIPGVEGVLSRIPLVPEAFVEGIRTDADSGPSLALGISFPLDGSVTRQALITARDAGLCLIEWQKASGAPLSLTKILYEASRAGIWNQVTLEQDMADEQGQAFFRFMASNPHIVHACRRPTDRFSLLDPAAGSLHPYGRAAPLPGVPLWRVLGDPVHVLLYLKRFGQKKVMHWRLRKGGTSAYGRGDSLRYHYEKPGDLPEGYLDEICRMVEAGGSVSMTWVRRNLERAFLVGYVMEEGVIVANSSLKHPRAEYIEKVKRLTGLDLGGYLERGYTSVRPEYRGMGIGTRILEGLTARIGDQKLFSIIGSDNLATQKIALRNKTRQVAAFYSESMGKEVGVWVPEWMIDK